MQCNYFSLMYIVLSNLKKSVKPSIIRAVCGIEQECRFSGKSDPEANNFMELIAAYLDEKHTALYKCYKVNFVTSSNTSKQYFRYLTNFQTKYDCLHYKSVEKTVYNVCRQF